MKYEALRMQMMISAVACNKCKVNKRMYFYKEQLSSVWFPRWLVFLITQYDSST